MRLPLLHSQQSIWNRIKDIKLESKELRVVYGFLSEKALPFSEYVNKGDGISLCDKCILRHEFKSSVSFTESRHTFYLSLSIATNPHNFVMAPMLDA